MKSLRERQDSQYLTKSKMVNMAKTNNPRFRTSFFTVISAFLAAVFLSIAVLSLFSSYDSFTAFADDEEDSKEEIDKLADDYIVDKDDGDPFWGTVDKFNKEGNPAAKKDFSSVMARLFTTQYMNDTHKGSAQSGTKNGIGGSGRNCKVDATGKGTPLYHNCDVPNIVTELVQDASSLLIQSGPNNAEIQKSTLMWGAFGLPSKIPGKGAPVDASERSVKYTALELYGYNLRYTSYQGEWDHIKVMTTARALANYGWMDNIKMSVTAVFQGVATGMEVASDNFTDEISTGNVFGAIGGFFTGFFEGAASGGIHSILDTSDLNVFNTYAWYRVGYGGTLYNARELTGTEVAARARAEMMNMITSGQPDDAKVPEDLEKIKSGPDYPKEAISKCVLLRGKLKNVSWGSAKTSPGVTKKKCASIAKSQYEIRQASDNPPKGDNADYKWTKDGNQKQESLASWKKRHVKTFEAAKKYGINCTMGKDGKDRAKSIAAFKSCWPDEYAGAESEALKHDQTERNEEWVKEKLGPNALQEWVAADPSRNFNAPWNRFVCTTASGKDKKKDGQLVMLYNAQGKHNDECGEVRPPIQDGLFGNGYLSDQNKPGLDTRNKVASSSFLSALLPFDADITTISNVGLGLATFATRVSNTVINLTFSPVFESLGIDKIVVKLIKEFRDSIFFPLVALMVAITGVMALWSAGKNKDYKRQFTSILLMAGVILSGVFLMYKPDMTLKAVDEVPAEIEKAIIGTIFAVGSDPGDQLCTSTGTVSGKKGTGLDGKRLSYNPNDSARSLMCENWRAFAFNPWVYGQWGTGMNNLYSKGSGSANTMNNTNGDLVGSASVNMGGGKKMKNWAVYQLNAMSSGTASYVDSDRPTGKIDRNFYRLIDLQAGPENGKGTDSRYFQTWSGSNWGDRLTVSFMAPIVAAFGAVTVIVYSITKIQIAFATVIMLLFLPFIFLIGIHPTMGRTKLKAYAGTIVGLMIQRVLLVLVMAVMFKVVVGFTTASGSYLINSLAAIAACIAFLIMRKQFLDFVFSTVSSKMGAPIGGQFVSDPEKWQREKVIRPNGFIANKSEVALKGAQTIAAGGIAGFVSGGVSGAYRNAAQATKIERDNLLNRQRRRGYGPLQGLVEATSAGKKDAQEKIFNDDNVKAAEREAVKKTSTYRTYEKKMKEYEEFDGVEQIEKDPSGKEITVKVASNGKDMVKPIEPTKLKSRNSSAQTRQLKNMVYKNRIYDHLESVAEKDYYNDDAARSDYETRKNEFDNLNEDRKAQDELINERASNRQEEAEQEDDEKKERLKKIRKARAFEENKIQKEINIVERLDNVVDKRNFMKEKIKESHRKAEMSKERNRKAREEAEQDGRGGN